MYILRLNVEVFLERLTAFKDKNEQAFVKYIILIEKKMTTLKSTSEINSGEKSRDTEDLKNFIEIFSLEFS